jgi:insecticidal toxin complex protein TccC
LQSKNIDAGLRVSLSDVRGLTLWTKDGLGNERTFEYDKLARVTSIYENVMEEKTVCCERFVYGDNTSKKVNTVGRLLKHYDSAGLHEIKSYSLLGSVLNESRLFRNHSRYRLAGKFCRRSEIIGKRKLYDPTGV